jgi:hypothetical protein
VGDIYRIVPRRAASWGTLTVQKQTNRKGRGFGSISSEQTHTLISLYKLTRGFNSHHQTKEEFPLSLYPLIRISIKEKAQKLCFFFFFFSNSILLFVTV